MRLHIDIDTDYFRLEADNYLHGEPLEDTVDIGGFVGDVLYRKSYFSNKKISGPVMENFYLLSNFRFDGVPIDMPVIEDQDFTLVWSFRDMLNRLDWSYVHFEDKRPKVFDQRTGMPELCNDKEG